MYFQINMNLEMVEEKLFDQGEISVHGFFNYNDSLISTFSPVIFLVGDSYLTINGKGDFKQNSIDVLLDLEKANIELINNFLPGNLCFNSLNLLKALIFIGASINNFKSEKLFGKILDPISLPATKTISLLLSKIIFLCISSKAILTSFILAIFGTSFDTSLEWRFLLDKSVIFIFFDCFTKKLTFIFLNFFLKCKRLNLL